mgnify:CR=1 FL=1
MKDTIQDTIQVALANAGAIGISLVQVNQVLTTFSLVVAIGFSIYKFYTTKNNNKKQKK